MISGLIFNNNLLWSFGIMLLTANFLLKFLIKEPEVKVKKKGGLNGTHK